MTKKTIALAAALLMALTAGCGSKDSDSTGTGASAYPEGTTRPSELGYTVSEQLFEKDFADIPDIDEGPLLTISNTTVKPGGTAEVTISVANAAGNWSMCGLHIVYPDILKCVLFDEINREPDYEPGLAIKQSIATVAREWQNNLPEDLQKAHKGSVFFTAVCPSDAGRDGAIATFYFKVPQNAQPGTVYNFDYYYSSNSATKDIFTNEASDPMLEKYAFSHWTGGTVTVE